MLYKPRKTRFRQNQGFYYGSPTNSLEIYKKSFGKLKKSPYLCIRVEDAAHRPDGFPVIWFCYDYDLFQCQRSDCERP